MDHWSEINTPMELWKIKIYFRRQKKAYTNKQTNKKKE
jgi:hypothetical protein